MTLLLDRLVLTKERLEKHAQGFANWAKGGLKGLIDMAKTRDVMLAELYEPGN